MRAMLPLIYGAALAGLLSMGTALARHQAQTDISAKAAPYGLAASAVDGMDVLAVEAAAKQAADFVRGGNGPYLLELRTYRFRAHSMADPDLYRSKEEIEEWKKRDPLALFEARLRAWGLLDDAGRARLEAEVHFGRLDGARRLDGAGRGAPVPQDQPAAQRAHRQHGHHDPSW